MFYQYPAYKDGLEQFAVIAAILGEAFKDFEVLDNTEKASLVFGCELWMESFNSLFALVKK